MTNALGDFKANKALYNLFQVFYFMQPDTTPLKMAKDITVKLGAERSNLQPSSEQPEESENREHGPEQTQPMTDTSQSELTQANQIQVVPLYTPASSAIKFFCVHPSHRYAMSLVPISTGFKGQVINTTEIEKNVSFLLKFINIIAFLK